MMPYQAVFVFWWLLLHSPQHIEVKDWATCRDGKFLLQHIRVEDWLKLRGVWFSLQESIFNGKPMEFIFVISGNSDIQDGWQPPPEVELWGFPSFLIFS